MLKRTRVLLLLMLLCCVGYSQHTIILSGFDNLNEFNYSLSDSDDKLVHKLNLKERDANILIEVPSKLVKPNTFLKVTDPNLSISGSILFYKDISTLFDGGVTKATLKINEVSFKFDNEILSKIDKYTIDTEYYAFRIRAIDEYGYQTQWVFLEADTKSEFTEISVPLFSKGEYLIDFYTRTKKLVHDENKYLGYSTWRKKVNIKTDEIFIKGGFE